MQPFHCKALLSMHWRVLQLDNAYQEQQKLLRTKSTPGKWNKGDIFSRAQLPVDNTVTTKITSTGSIQSRIPLQTL